MSIKPARFKGVECVLCGWSGRVIAHIPIKMAWCQHCGKGYGLRRWKAEDSPKEPELFDLMDALKTSIADYRKRRES